MTCLLDRETYRRWERYFNANGLPLPARYEMRDYTPAPLPDHPQVPRPPHKKPRPEPVKVTSKAARLAKLWTEAEEARLFVLEEGCVCRERLGSDPAAVTHLTGCLADVRRELEQAAEVVAEAERRLLTVATETGLTTSSRAKRG